MSLLSQLNHHRRGLSEGPKLVFLHGLMGSWHNWRRILTHFEPRYEVFAIDQRGHGRSYRPQTGYAPENYAQDLKQALDELGWQSIILVGHSMGARNAIQFAYEYPERVQKLVIEDMGPEINPELNGTIERILEKVPTPFHDKALAKETILSAFPKNQVLAQYLYSNIAEVSPGVFDWRFYKEGILESLAQGRTRNWWHEYKSLNMPILIVRGENSQDLERSLFEKMLKENPKAQGVEIKGAGHWVHFDKPQEFIESLEAFF